MCTNHYHIMSTFSHLSSQSKHANLSPRPRRGGLRVSGIIIIVIVPFAIITITMTGIWSEEDDMKLWLLRTKPLSQLSRTFNKTAGAVRSRLIHLQDPTHKAYQRLVKNGVSPIAIAATACHLVEVSFRA